MDRTVSRVCAGCWSPAVMNTSLVLVVAALSASQRS